MRLTDIANQYHPVIWTAIAVLCIVFPPVGVFLLAFVGVNAVVKTEQDEEVEELGEELDDPDAARECHNCGHPCPEEWWTGWDQCPHCGVSQT